MTVIQSTRPDLTHAQAVEVIRHHVAEFAANLGQHGYHETELATLTRKLSWLIDADINRRDIEDIIEDYLELGLLDTGDHEDLIHTRNGAIDEGGAIRDRLTSSLDFNLKYAAQNAGIRPETRHPPRVCIDEDCPNCGWPERWADLDPEHGPKFGCNKCSYTSRERAA